MSPLDMSRFTDEHLNTMVALAFDLDDAEAIQELAQTPDPELSPMEHTTADMLLTAAYAKADRQSKRSRSDRIRSSLQRVMPVIMRIAACILVAATLSFTVAFASSPVFRSRVMKIVQRLESNDTMLGFYFEEDASRAFVVPQEWTGTNFPAMLPDGFSVSDTSSNPASITYTSRTGQYFCFTEHTEETTVTGSTQDASTRCINVGGRIAYLVKDEMDTNLILHITWQKDNRFFTVYSENIDVSMLLEIASSVRKIVR